MCIRDRTGAAPFLGGGFGHFFHYAPEKIEYAINRFAMEAKRQLDLLDKELATKPYIAGDDYTIADIAIWSWYGRLAQDKVWDRAGIFLDVKEYKHLQAWTEKIANRPAVQRGLEVEYKEIDASVSYTHLLARFPHVYQRLLVTERSEKNLAFYQSLGFVELSEQACTGMIYKI